ncbi:MAG TPA: hypothetical protein VK752_31100 [Bryobacteraceae bacterium]|nr:hypothetical protein [Bryobacteraceae bacterium]
MFKFYTRRFLAFAVLLFAPLAPAQSSLHLITGAYNQGWMARYASALFEVGQDGKITKTVDLVTKREGFIWMGMSFEMKQAAILSGGDSASVTFLNLNSAEVTKACDLPEFLQGGWARWLANVPGQGIVLEMANLGEDYLHDPWELYALVADPAIECDESLGKISVQDVRYAIPQAVAGVGDFAMSDGMDSVFADPNGNFSKRMGVGNDVALGFKIPNGLLSEGGRRNVFVSANTSRLLVASVGYAPHSHLLVLKKSDNTWHIIPQALGPAGLRAFGKYVAMVEASTKKSIAAQLKEHPGMVNIDNEVRSELGPGKSEWRGTDGIMGPSQVESFAIAGNVYPGRLHIFDTDTENVYTITTNQGDSEILLIEGGTVYYRVSDRLYSAAISDKGLGEAHLIATDEVVRDAHWAFLTRN